MTRIENNLSTHAPSTPRLGLPLLDEGNPEEPSGCASPILCARHTDAWSHDDSNPSVARASIFAEMPKTNEMAFPDRQCPHHVDRFTLPPTPVSGFSLLDEQTEVLSSWDAAIETCVCDLHDCLQAQPSLEPSLPINAMFSKLVGLTDDHDPQVAERVLSDPRVEQRLSSLCKLCARGECALENHWYERILRSTDAQKELEAFPYYSNYEQLTRLEMHSVLGLVEDKPRRVLFIGSGPLPLTSLLLSKKYGVCVDNIDIDPLAASAGARFARRLGEIGLTFKHATVGSLSRDALAGYDVVYIAALAGLSHADKDAIFQRLASTLKSGALILARSAHLLRRLLYPAVSHVDMRRYFKPLIEVHPYNEIVNSVLIGRLD